MKKILSVLLIILCLSLSACVPEHRNTIALSIEDIPEYSGEAYVELENNQPNFTDSQKQKVKSFERYSKLDKLGRCGVAYASVSTELMPTKKRDSISSVKPTGWVQNEYAFISDRYVYNRCHLIGYQLTGENANERNLITGTRYMNLEGMLPFENLVAEYVTSTGNHVLYRVTPIFEGDNLLASGVEMEGWSVEDNGKGVCFNVYCYNVQPGVRITYANGKNKSDGTIKVSGKSSVSGKSKVSIKSNKTSAATGKYILNISSMKFHSPDCSGVSRMNSENRKTFTGSRSDLIKQGYEPCGMCKP